MPEVTKKERIAAPASAVWTLIGPFDRLADWLTPITMSETAGDGLGAVRTLTMDNGAVIKERLDAHDDAGMTFTYSMVDTGPLPLDGYQSTVKVEPAGADACTITWSGRFDAAGAPEAEVVALVEGVYDAGFAGVRGKLEGPSSSGG